ncbi:MAG TPA: Rrf2 family transcriptional regulator, partial [Allocoleopsis sp.]
MELSAKVEYALLALLEIAGRPAQKEPLKISEISTRQSIPDRYLEQILTNLRRDGIVQSQRGAKGGYVLARDPWKITLLDIVTCMEGENQTELSRSSRLEKQREVTVERDLLQGIWQQAREAAQAVLSQYTIADVCERREAA